MSGKNRTCKVCNDYKDISNFQPQGYQCRSCRNKKQRDYWQSLPEDIRKSRQAHSDAQRIYKEKNSEKIKEQSRAQHLKRKFNMTVEQYDEILNLQGGVCFICKETCKTNRSLAVDHDHITGDVRGLLCKNCNTALGLFRDNINLMMNAIEYLNTKRNNVIANGNP